MKTCTVDGCDKKHKAKGFCGTHYNQQNPNTHRTITVLCDGCGSPCQKEPARRNRYPLLYCTSKCKAAHEWHEHRASKTAARQQIATYQTPSKYLIALASYWIQQRQQQAPRTFKAGNCAVCSTPFLCLYGSRTCSEPCQQVWLRSAKHEAKHRRRARERNAYVAPVIRHIIYARDNHTCQLCGEPIDMNANAPHPRSPSIDHIIPLARGGTHEPGNVQAAHFLCNSLKGDKQCTSNLAA